MSMRPVAIKLLSLAAVLVLVSACSTTPAPTVTNAPFYAVTRGSATQTSELHYFDETGAAELVGDLGHAVIALKFDPTDGTLYAITRSQDTNDVCNSCLLTVDPTTAAVTVVGTIDTDADTNTEDGPVASIAFDASGQLYGWTENTDDFMVIDKTDATATIPSDSGVSSWGHGMWFQDGAIHWINGSGDVYTIATGTGTPTLVRAGADIAADAGIAYNNDLQIRGDYDPDSGEYWGVSPTYSYGPASGVARLMVDGSDADLLGVAQVDGLVGIHTLAFER